MNAPATKPAARNGAASPLTPRQRRFADLVVEGRPASAAYKLAGYRPKSSDVAAVCASQLLRRPMVAALVESGRAELAKKSRLTREERLRLLAEIAEDAATAPRDRIAAVRTINEMTGDNAPQRLELDGGPNLLATLTDALGRIDALSPLVLRTVAGRVVAGDRQPPWGLAG